MFQYVLLFLLAWPTETQLFNPDEIATVLEPICDNDYEDCIPDNYDDCEDKVTSDIGESELEFGFVFLNFDFVIQGTALNQVKSN